MGITISCKKTGRSIDLGYGGLLRIRNRVATLVGEPFSSHYLELSGPAVPWIGDARKAYFEKYDKITERMVQEKKVSVKVADFLYQSDCEGNIHYGACKELLKIIGDYDDNILYGYCGRPDCARFVDFKAILQDCADHRCDMVWQ